MKSFKQFIQESNKKVGFLYNAEKLDDPEVLVSGFGRMSLSRLKKEALKKAEDLAKSAKRGEFERVNSALQLNSFQSFVQAIVDAEEEIEQMKRGR